MPHQHRDHRPHFHVRQPPSPARARAQAEDELWSRGAVELDVVLAKTLAAVIVVVVLAHEPALRIEDGQVPRFVPGGLEFGRARAVAPLRVVDGRRDGWRQEARAVGHEEDLRAPF